MKMTKNDYQQNEKQIEERFEEIEKSIPEEIDTSEFEPVTSQELIEILGLTIKRDDKNKLATLLCQLSAYTEDSQFNISFNAPSSTGKSYIPMEIARLFPQEDVKEISYCSPTAFYHDAGEFDKEKKGYVVNLSRKILIFLDQPHAMLLERLRSLLSHDKKEITSKITDKSQRAGLRTKTVYIKGFPAVIFCSAGLNIDEQEGTRFLLLSPEASQDKFKQGIHEKIMKETDSEAYYRQLEDNPQRKLLKERIKAIRNERIDNINIDSPESIEKVFLENKDILKGRHQRDVGRLISFIKAFALINLWHRKRSGDTIFANEEDVKEAVSLWSSLAESQDYNLPPYIYNLYKDIIVTTYEEINEENHGDEIVGVPRQKILEKHNVIYGNPLSPVKFRQEIIPMLEMSGLIHEQPDPNDKRIQQIYLASTENSNENGKDGMIVDELTKAVNDKFDL